MEGQCAASSVGCQEEQAWATGRREKRCALILVCFKTTSSKCCVGFFLFVWLMIWGLLVKWNQSWLFPPQQDAAGFWGNPPESLPPQPSWARHGCSQAAEAALAAWVWAHPRLQLLRGEVLWVHCIGSCSEEAKGLWLLPAQCTAQSRGINPLSPAPAVQDFFQNAIFDWANCHFPCWVFFGNDLFPQCLGTVPHQPF